MKTPSWFVVDGNVRLLCYRWESVEAWISYIVARGGAPRVEVTQ
jgi:hypothetical protein